MAKDVGPEDVALAAALEAIAVRVRRLPVSPAMSPNAASVLRACALEGPQRISDLATRLGVSQPGASQLVDRMSALGLVERRHDRHDRRGVLVAITAAGRRSYQQRRSDRARIIADLLATLPAADRRRLRAATPGLRQLANTPNTATRKL